MLSYANQSSKYQKYQNISPGQSWLVGVRYQLNYNVTVVALLHDNCSCMITVPASLQGSNHWLVTERSHGG